MIFSKCYVVFRYTYSAFLRNLWFSYIRPMFLKLWITFYDVHRGLQTFALQISVFWFLRSATICLPCTSQVFPRKNSNWIAYLFAADLIYRCLHLENDLFYVLMCIILENDIMTNLFLLDDHTNFHKFCFEYFCKYNSGFAVSRNSIAGYREILIDKFVASDQRMDSYQSRSRLGG
jgi:hypothetical protein